MTGARFMRYKNFNHEKIEEMGEDTVSYVVTQLMDSGILEQFANGVANLDYSNENKEKFQFQRDFDKELDTELILYHLTCYISTLSRVNAIDYIKTKRFFSGYVSDESKTAFYHMGLSHGLDNYQKVANINKHKFENPRIVNQEFVYDSGVPLGEAPIPYFYNINEIGKLSYHFGVNLASIRKPKYPKLVIGFFQEKSKELYSLPIVLLEHLFVE